MNDKLIKIQKALKVPKNNTNAFGNYKYRSAEDILESVKPLVHKEGLSLILFDEVVNVGNSNYIKATAQLTGQTDNEISTTEAVAYAREALDKKGMDDAQITGSASSYARKYALNGLFAIDDTKDADSQDNTQHVARVEKPKADPIAKAKDELNKMLESYGHDNSVKKKVVIQKVLGKSTVDSQEEADEVMQALTDEAV